MALPKPDADLAVARLTAAIARGDRSAFAQFYEAWFDRALRRLRQLTGKDEHAALDLVQDVMLKVAEKLPPLSDERALDAWMAKTMLSTALDRRRAEVRRTLRETSIARTEIDPTAAALEELCASEQWQWVRVELARMEPADRALLEARYFRGATHAQIARLCGTSSDSVSSRIHRTLKSLAARAKGWFRDE